jgi:dTDP-4-amino-4,6-dideoxygalactose transaminase
MNGNPVVPFGDLKRQYLFLQYEIDAAIALVLHGGWYILGKELEAFEHEFAAAVGARYAVGVASGTDAIHVALSAAGVGPGDEVITVANTTVPTVAGIMLTGAVPVLVDVEPDNYNMDPAAAERAITPRTRAVVPVHLYGQAPDMRPILDMARKHCLVVVEDAAQGHGATYGDEQLGTLGTLGCFSFYPSKNLGALGDAGAVVTDDKQLADRVRMIRNHGQRTRYDHEIKGWNSRLDELQAAVLRVKLPHLPAWNARRRAIAARYLSEIINPRITLGTEMSYGRSNYHLFVVQVDERARFQAHLVRNGVESFVHYPVPIHRQTAFPEFACYTDQLPVTDALAPHIVSLPMFPELSDAEIVHVIRAVNGYR